MIRYQIETAKAGVLFDTALIARFASTRATTRPQVIAYVEPANQRKFEKYIEGMREVIGYRADPRDDSTSEKEWTR